MRGSSQDSRLREVMRMVRIGLPSEGSVHDLRGQIESRINELKGVFKRHPEDQVARLKLLTLEAESLHQSGRVKESVQVLTPLWEELEPLVRKKTLAQVAKVEGRTSRPLLRQKIWGALHFIWFNYYALMRRNAEGVELLDSVGYIIEHELATPEYSPSGTRAIQHYFIGHCHRAQRNFREAEKHFLEAQKEAQNRLDNKLKEKDSDRDYEIAFNNVFVARVLGAGLSWIVLQEGRLSNAEHLLRAALALLSNTRQQSVKQFVNSILEMAVRRRASVGTRDYANAVQSLERCFDDFKADSDISGQLRCAGELVRAYLDLVQFAKTNKQDDVGKAELWLGKFKELSDLSEASADRKSAVRYDLLDARFKLLSGDVRGARETMGKIHEAAKSRNAIVTEFGTEISILDAAIFLEERDKPRAKATLKEALAKFKPRPEGVGLFDPVLEAECHLLFIKAGTPIVDQAQMESSADQLRALSQFVENAYLLHLSHDINISKYPAFHKDPDLDFDSKTALTYKKEFERWLDDVISIRFQHASHSELAKIKGVSTSTICRKDKDKEQCQEKKPQHTNLRRRAVG